MPVTWSELADVDPAVFTMASVPDLVARREDPWADIDDRRTGIEPLLEMVARDDSNGLGDMPYPPSYPKMPGEPPRSRAERLPHTGMNTATGSMVSQVRNTSRA